MTDFKDFTSNDLNIRYGKSKERHKISMDILNVIDEWRVDNESLYGTMSDEDIRKSITAYVNNKIDISNYDRPKFLPPFVWQFIISQIVKYIIKILIEKYINTK